MKTAVLPCLAALSGLLAADPVPIPDLTALSHGSQVSKQDPQAQARIAVMTQIVSRLQPASMPPFSRAVPVRPYPTFRAVELVDGEERLPFTVEMLGRGAEVGGYVRILDAAIFINRPERKDHIRSTLDPRFAPVKLTKPEPEDPA